MVSVLQGVVEQTVVAVTGVPVMVSVVYDMVQQGGVIVVTGEV